MCGLHGAAAVVVRSDPETWRELVDTGEVGAAVLRADTKASRPLTALVTRDLDLLGDSDLRHAASAGASGDSPRASRDRAGRRARAACSPLRPAVRACAGVAKRRRSRCSLPWRSVVAGVLLAMLGSAATGASRFQRAADLAAVSAARSMRDDHHRLFLPAALPSGVPNPAHLSDSEYRRRATAAALEAAAANGAEEVSTDRDLPGAAFAPTRVRVGLSASPASMARNRGPRCGVRRRRRGLPGEHCGPSPPLEASGGGYSGPLATRQGEGMRPDVARAFDAMFAAGVCCRPRPHRSTPRFAPTQSRRRSSRPTPTPAWSPGRARRFTAAAPSSTSARQAPTAGSAANAQRFGFVQRYSWEAWHYGYVRGPAPCSASGDRVAGGRERRRRQLSGGPALVRPGPLPRRPSRGRRRAGTFPPTFLPRSSSPSPTSTRSPSRPRAQAASPSSCRGPRPRTALPTPSTRTVRSTPRPI